MLGTRVPVTKVLSWAGEGLLPRDFSTLSTLLLPSAQIAFALTTNSGFDRAVLFELLPHPAGASPAARTAASASGLIARLVNDSAFIRGSFQSGGAWWPLRRRNV